ncbi:hypothetical protein TNCV_1090281 [Trichonephila clavipes]|uniref:Uncharacterized protein n=1 Tax=Trichonephila clavipes TaxID=2585209 RepID=A0A8X6VL98_TRICX|nr:hypothetical protein TNCV_1090281 [Trichonephila clavipes]
MAQTSKGSHLGKLPLWPTDPLYHCRDFRYGPEHKKSGCHSPGPGSKPQAWAQKGSDKPTKLPSRHNYTQDQNKPSSVDLYLPKPLIILVPFWIADTGHRKGKRNVRWDLTPGWGESY